MTSQEKICPLMSTSCDTVTLCQEDKCAWYMTFADVGQEQGVCSVAFGMLCQQGAAGKLEFAPTDKPEPSLTYEQKLDRLKKSFINTQCSCCHEYCGSTTSELKQCDKWRQYKAAHM